MREKHRRMVRPPKVPTFKLHAKQWRRKFGPRLASDKRDARPDEMPAAWMDRAAPYRLDSTGRDALAFNRYEEEPLPRAAGICGFGLLGRYVATDTRTQRWRIERKAQCEDRLDPKRQGGRGTGSEIAAGLRAVSFSESAPQALRSGLGPVAITVLAWKAYADAQAEQYMKVRRIISDATAWPGWKPFNPDAYEWPDDMAKFNKH